MSTGVALKYYDGAGPNSCDDCSGSFSSFTSPCGERDRLLPFAADKHRAVTGKWRISEAALLAGALFGPFGAFAAMQVFRHKTQKRRFFLVPLFCFVQILAFLWLATGTP